MAQVGAVLGGRYVLDEQIGNGGYGEVWRATDTVLSRSVAIKLLHPRHTGQGEAIARFRAEARHAAALCHENIAQVYDYGDAAGGQPPYLVMELVAGASLETVMADGPLDATRTMDNEAQTAAGLQAAHAAGLIHRDIKPGNLLLTPTGTVKITDFGIAYTVGSASVTATGELVGTPSYLAPERAMGEGAGPASDLYSLGIVAYECLAGVRPYSGTPLEVALAHWNRPLPPLPPSVAADVTAFVMRMTAKDPASRVDDAAEVAAWAGLLRDGAGARSATLRQGRGTPPPDRARRRAVVAYAGAAFAAVIVIVVASIIGFASPSRPVTTSPSPASSLSSTPASSPKPTSRDSGVAAPSASRRPATSAERRPATSPARPPSAGPAANRPPAPVVPVVKATPPGKGEGPGNDDGPGNGNGNGKGKGKGKGKGDGNGNGQGD
jgi:serine/threonine-protein kinase